MKTIHHDANPFDILVRLICKHHERPAHSLVELKEVQSTKAKGDLFELFCARYLRIIKKYDRVLLLRDLSLDMKRQLNLPGNNADYGIDIVCFSADGTHSAAQCKFKAPTPPKRVVFRKKNAAIGEKIVYPCVRWQEIATFHALCDASGPWSERITMTTAPYVKRLGGIRKREDKSICCASFRSLSVDALRSLISPKKSVSALREAASTVAVATASAPESGTINSRKRARTEEKETEKKRESREVDKDEKEGESCVTNTGNNVKSENNDRNPTLEELRAKRVRYFERLLVTSDKNSATVQNVN